MVVLITGISFVGYIFIKLMGARRGILLTGLFGGIVSSTVVTLNFSRMAKEKDFSNIFAAGILVASGTMFPRMLLYVLVVNYNLFSHLIIPIVMMTVVAYAAVLWFLLKGTKIDDSTKRQAISISNPFQLLPALAYGVLLAAIILLSYTFKEWFGNKGIYLLSLFSGISDVEAITIALSKLGKSELPAVVVSKAIIIAAMMNTFVKSLLVAIIAGKSMGIKIFVAFGLIIVSGLIGFLLI